MSGLDGWAPEPVEDHDPMSSDRLAALAGALGPEVPPWQDDTIVPAWALCGFFHDRTPLSGIGTDGHPAGGRFIPPVAHHGRMHVGRTLRTVVPVRTDQPASRTASLVSAVAKGRPESPLVFVTVRLDHHQAGRLAVVEEQTHAYRLTPRAQRPERHGVPDRGDWSADPVALFRFSAATGNAHRIHYDVDYAREEEGYSGLLVHGPMQVLALSRFAERWATDHEIRLRGDGAARLRLPMFAGDRVHVLVERAGSTVVATLRGRDDAVLSELTTDLEESS